MILLLFIINVILCFIYKTLYCRSGHMGKSIYGVGMTYGFRHPLMQGEKQGQREGLMEGWREQGEEQNSLNLLISKYII